MAYIPSSSSVVAFQSDPTKLVGTVSVAGSDVASGAADSGGPIKIGGRFNTTLPTFTNGQRGDIQIGSRGALLTGAQFGANINALNMAGNLGDGNSGSGIVGVQPHVWNGGTYDRAFGNSSIGTLVSTGASSVITIPFGSTNASVIAVLQAPSIVGSYAEDAPHTTADKGVFSLNVRNDTMSSVTSTDGDYGALSVGPMGEAIVANAPITKWISAQTSVMYGVSVQGIAPQGASVFTYITGINIANDSATFSRVKITGGLGSVLTWTVAPANGGSNIIFANGIKTGENSGVSASISGVSSVYVTMTGFISKT